MGFNLISFPIVETRASVDVSCVGELWSFSGRLSFEWVGIKLIKQICAIFVWFASSDSVRRGLEVTSTFQKASSKLLKHSKQTFMLRSPCQQTLRDNWCTFWLITNVNANCNVTAWLKKEKPTQFQCYEALFVFSSSAADCLTITSAPLQHKPALSLLIIISPLSCFSCASSDSQRCNFFLSFSFIYVIVAPPNAREGFARRHPNLIRIWDLAGLECEQASIIKKQSSNLGRESGNRLID